MHGEKKAQETNSNGTGIWDGHCACGTKGREAARNAVCADHIYAEELQLDVVDKRLGRGLLQALTEHSCKRNRTARCRLGLTNNLFILNSGKEFSQESHSPQQDPLSYLCLTVSQPISLGSAVAAGRSSASPTRHPLASLKAHTQPRPDSLFKPKFNLGKPPLYSLHLSQVNMITIRSGEGDVTVLHIPEGHSYAYLA